MFAIQGFCLTSRGIEKKMIVKNRVFTVHIYLSGVFPKAVEYVSSQFASRLLGQGPVFMTALCFQKNHDITLYEFLHRFFML